MLFVLQLLQLTAKRLMMRLAIQQLGKHDRVPPAGCCMRWPGNGRAQSRWLGKSEHHGGRLVAAPTVRFVQRHNMAALAEPEEPPGGPLLASRLFHVSLSYFSARAESVWSPPGWSCDQTCRVLWNYSTFWHFYCLLLDLLISGRLNSCSCKKNKQKRCPGTCLCFINEAQQINMNYVCSDTQKWWF